MVQAILLPMANIEQRESKACPRCDLVVRVGDALRGCAICRTVICHHCSVEDFGRHFCSDRCRDYFFHGDGDEDEQEDE